MPGCTRRYIFLPEALRAFWVQGSVIREDAVAEFVGLSRHQAPVVRRVRPKFFYLTQAESEPPTFVFFVSDADRVMATYARYIEAGLRKLFRIAHAPMRVKFRSSHKKDGK